VKTKYQDDSGEPTRKKKVTLNENEQTFKNKKGEDE
jgi:hypothetical protein